MHRYFRDHLDGAKGVSEFVIALNIDIRGFSEWSLEVDSAQTALFIKKIYAKIIDEYFGDAAFVKPTGDGLLVVLGFDEGDVAEAVTTTVENSIAIVKGFGALCVDEPAINYGVPSDVGIGISRGAASRLAAEDVTLDYSGRVLNLASRLMDLARPKGVVFDDHLGFKLLPKNLRSKFRRHDVYLKGVSARSPLRIHCWPKAIEPPRANLFPVGDPQWEHLEEIETCSGLEGQQGSYIMDLANHPPDPSTLTCEIKHDQVTPSGKRSKIYETSSLFPVEYVDRAGIPQAHIDQALLATFLKKSGVGARWPVVIRVSYRLA